MGLNQSLDCGIYRVRGIANEDRLPFGNWSSCHAVCWSVCLVGELPQGVPSPSFVKSLDARVSSWDGPCSF